MEREMLFQGVRLQMVSDLFFQSKKKKKGEFDLGAVSEQSTFFFFNAYPNKQERTRTTSLSAMFSVIYLSTHARCSAPTPKHNSFICHTDGQFSRGLPLP